MTRPLAVACCLAATAVLLTGCMGGGGPQLSEQQRRIVDLNERALGSYDKGYVEDAARLLQEALRLASSLDDDEGQITTLLNQARLARRSGDLTMAAQRIEQAGQRAGTGIYAADVKHELALQALAANRLDQAVLLAQAAVQAEHGGLIGRRLNLLARIYLAQNKPELALLTAEQALSANRDDLLAEEQANALRIIGQVKGQQQQWSEAQQALDRALALDKQQELPTKIAADLEALAGLAKQQGNTTAERDYQARARRVRETLRQGIRSSE